MIELERSYRSNCFGIKSLMTIDQVDLNSELKKGETMQEELWSRMLDSEAPPEQYAKHVSPEFLTYMKEQSAALDVGRRAKLLISFLYVNEEQMEKFKETFKSYCEESETDPEEWLRIVAGIVLRWLKSVPKDRVDPFSESEKRIIEQVRRAQKGDDPNAKFTLPFDVIPTHWPFLAPEALPKMYDISASDSNHHFTAKPRTKKVKILISSRASETAAARPVEKPNPLPEKMRDLLAQNSNLLTESNRQILNNFFSSGGTNIGEPLDVLVCETKKNSVERPGQIEVLTMWFRLSPGPTWKVVKKVKFVPGQI